MGPRRVGKTVIMHHCIERLLKNGIDCKRICFLSIDQPLYNGIDLEKLLFMYANIHQINLEKKNLIFLLMRYSIIKNDIVDKVLMRDLPSLYGIQGVQKLNYFFYNSSV
jgi:hypothetical protein